MRAERLGVVLLALAACARAAAELFLVEADTGRIAARLPIGVGVEFVLARRGKILALVLSPPARMELVEVSLD